MIPLLDLARTLHSLWELLGQRTAPHLRDILAIGPQEVQVSAAAIVVDDR